MTGQNRHPFQQVQKCGDEASGDFRAKSGFLFLGIVANGPHGHRRHEPDDPSPLHHVKKERCFHMAGPFNKNGVEQNVGIDKNAHQAFTFFLVAAFRST